ncbi:hypothetical protein BCR36DRAFT_442300 [Piromyces finnis]|uniref:Uncharacterized protein n=1 Tax=Piromyces finnis TaxID=1754191 RepID=A0A1Y1VFR2_9FUNG|nr:hypothetical protein BCR36DRAFT_442300 [Piromyces finnis]|eukprot:ORX53791.1 hypothetical protein BCR36DRAFT_442300 [Piromyces finnis]
MLKANNGNIKINPTKNEKVKENKSKVNDDDDDYKNLSSKTKSLIKNEFKKNKKENLSDILSTLNDFIDIVNNFNDFDCSYRNELSFLLWKRSEQRNVKSLFQCLKHENFIEKVTQFFDEEYYYDIESEVLQNILNLFIELITPTYYEEDKINDNISKWTFGIHELFSDYDPLPLYQEENDLIKERINILYEHPSNIFNRFLSRLFFIFIIDESDKNTTISSKNELNECRFVVKFLLLAWKFGDKTILSKMKKLSYNDVSISDLLSVAIWRIITEYDIYNSKQVSKTFWMVVYLFDNINEGNPIQHFLYVSLAHLFINKESMTSLDNLTEEDVDIDFKSITEKIFYFSLKNYKNILINKELTFKMLKKIDEREDVNNLSLAIIKYFSLQLSNIKKVNEHSPLKFINKELLWILINAKSMNINLSKAISPDGFFNDNYLNTNSSTYRIYSTISFSQKPLLYNLEVLLCTYYIEKSSMIELTSLFLDEIKNIKVEVLKKDNKKMILYNENKHKKYQLLKRKHENKKNSIKNSKEVVSNNKDSDNNSNSNEITTKKNLSSKQKLNKHYPSTEHIEESLLSIEEWRENFYKLCGLLTKLKKKKNVEYEKEERDAHRYNPLHKHIWNIYCVNDIFFRIINKFFIFQNDDNGSELMNIVSSMNESSKKLNISSIITQSCANFINMLIDIKSINIYSSEYLYLITMMLVNVEKSLKKFYRKPTYWIKVIDDIVKILFPFHFLETFNQPVEAQGNKTIPNKESFADSDTHPFTTNHEAAIIKNQHISNSSIDPVNETIITTTNSSLKKENTLNTNSIIPSLFLSNHHDHDDNNDNDNHTNLNSNKLSLPSLSSSSSSTFLPPISPISSNVPSKIPGIEKKLLKRCDFLDPISKPSSPLQSIDDKSLSLSRSSSTSSLDNDEEFYQTLTKHNTIKNKTIEIKNEIKLFLVKSIIRNIEETIKNCDYIPLNLCSIPLPSLKNHKRSISVIQKKNTLISLPNIKTPLPPTTKKPKNQSIQKKRSSISNSKSISITDSNQKLEKPEKFKKIECQSNNNNNNEQETTLNDITTDSEIYDDFDSESSLDSRNKESGNEDEKENELHFNKKTNIYEQETIYFIQFKLKEYIEFLKQYIIELNTIKVNCNNYLILSLQNLIEKHMLFLQSYYKRTAASTNIDSAKPYPLRKRQHTAIEPSSLTPRSSYSTKVDSIKNPVILSKTPSVTTRNGLRDPLLLQNRLKIYSSLPLTKTPLHVNVTNIVLDPIKRNCKKIPNIKYDTKVK